MNRHRLIPMVALLAIAGTCLTWAAADKTTPATPATFPAVDLGKANPRPVVRVVDGDTFVIDRDGTQHAVRLIGVDTPETVHPSMPVQAYGKEASRFLTNLLKGERVYVVLDPQQGEKDRYGRLLGYVYRVPDGMFVNAEIIRQGYGHAYTRYPFKYMAGFKKLEQFAKLAEKGLWAPGVTVAQPKPTPAVKPKPTPKPEPAAITVYVTRTGKKYHRGSCRYLRRSRIPMKLKAAKLRYGPCSVCLPPG